MRIAVAAVSVLSLLAAWPAAVPASGPDSVALGCEVVRAKTSPAIEPAYSVVVKNTSERSLPAGTSISIVLISPGGTNEDRASKLASPLLVGATATVLTERNIVIPHAMCQAGVPKNEVPRLGTPPPTPAATPAPATTASSVPTAKPSYTATDGSGIGGGGVATHPIPSPSSDSVSNKNGFVPPAASPTPTPKPAPIQ